MRVCSECHEHPRNSRFGPLCTQCGKSRSVEQPATDVQPGETPRRRQKRAASASCKKITEGGISKFHHGWFPVEIVHSLEASFLSGLPFFSRLAAASPRLIQLIGPGSEAWEGGVRELIRPWVAQQLRALNAPAGMDVSSSPASVLLATITESSSDKRAGGGQLKAHQDYSPAMYPGEAGWNFLILMNDTDELEACQVAWIDSRDHDDPSDGKRTREWLDKSFARMSCVGEWGTAYVFDCAVWHGVERMLPRTCEHATRAAVETGQRGTASATGGATVRCRTSLVIDCRTPGLPPPFFEDPGVQVWQR